MIEDMATMSKAFQIFDSNVRGMKQHLQLMDASLVNANKICHSVAKDKSVKTIADALKSSVDYPQLNTPCKTKDINRTFITARIKVHEQAIVDLYSYYMAYLFNLTKEFMTINTVTLIREVAPNQNNKMSYEDILSHSRNELIEIMSKVLLKQLEGIRDTKKVLQKIIKYSGITLTEKVLEEALVYLNIRHLIIHNGAKADDAFIKMNNGLVQIKNKNKLVINYELSSKAIQTVFSLCSEIDNKLLEKKLLNPVATSNKKGETK